MTNPNVLATDADFAAWEAQIQEPYGQEMFVEASAELTDPNRALACSSVADFAIIDLAPESIDMLTRQ